MPARSIYNRDHTGELPTLSKSLPLLAACLISTLASPAQLATAPSSGPAPRPFILKAEPTLTQAQKLALVRQHVKYVFILFQENRSFDFYFGSYPGADGLYNRPPEQVPGFRQPIVNVDGSVTSITPFRIPAFVTDKNGLQVPLYPSDVASVNHSHTGMVNKVHLDANDLAANDRFALTEEGITLDFSGKPSRFPTLARKQVAELVMGHLDCDTAPFLWRYADRFTLFDHFFATELGPSTPNAIALLSGQLGETQWLLHPETEVSAKNRAGLPMLADPEPLWSPRKDAIDRAKQTNDPKTKSNAPNLTFATLPLTLLGQDAATATAKDNDPLADLADIREDIEKIAGRPNAAVPWGWYQQGYDHEPSDLPDRASHKTYVAHHNAPAYFGYLANNPAIESNIHGLADFYNDLDHKALPASGVFYVRGGYGNIRGWHPLDPNPRLATVFNGNDDHPGYSDSQLSEALLAEEINAIAASPYWSQSAIFIAYDESDGLYDHAQPHFRTHDPAGLVLSQGPRIPFLVISPYGEAHVVSHEPAEHSSVIKFVNELFNLAPLASLPDEQRARVIGLTKYHESMGPADDGVSGVGDLLSAFSNARLLGKKPLLPASYAQIPAADVTTFPHYNYGGCKVMTIRPTDSRLPNPVPSDFNPRPETTPGIPTSGTWTP